MTYKFDVIHLTCAALSGIIIGYFLGVNTPNELIPTASGDLATWTQTLFIIASIIITAASILYERAIKKEFELDAERISAQTLSNLANEIYSEITEIDNLVADYKEKQSDREYMAALNENEIDDLSKSKNNAFRKIMERLSSTEDGSPVHDFLESSKILRSHLKGKRLINLLELHNSATRLRSRVSKIDPEKLKCIFYYDIRVEPALGATKRNALIFISSLKPILNKI